MFFGSLKWDNPQLYFHCEGEGGGGGGGAGGQSPDDKGTGNSIQVQVGEELMTFTPEQVVQAVTKAGSLEKTVEGLSGFQKVLTQYGVGADEYVRNSEAAFAIANSLIEQGIIDEQGNVVQKKTEPAPRPSEGNLGFKFLQGDTKPSKELEVIAAALKTIGARVEKLDEGQANIYRRNIKRDVQAIHPDLDDSDISKLLATAQHDKSKNFWDHAEALAGVKSANIKQTEKSYVKSTIETLIKIGAIKEGTIDLEKLDSLDLNSLKESDPSGGAPIYEGKKFMFQSRRRRLGKKQTEGFSSPSEVTHEMFRKKGLSP